MVDKVSVELSIEDRKALQGINRLEKEFDSFSRSATKSVSRLDIAIGSAVGIGAAKGVELLASGFRSLTVGAAQAAAATETIKTRLEVLSGSAETATNLFKELTDFSSSTPFQLQNISESAAQLLAFGFEAETVTERLKNIGEVAAGANTDISDITLIFGQVAAAGKLTGERLLQLQERSITLGPALAKTLGIAETEVRDFVSAGKVGFKEFEEAFNSLSGTGGKFEGALQKQINTINGSISNLGDNFFTLQTKIGEAFGPEIITAIKLATDGVQKLTAAFSGSGADEAASEVQRLEAQLVSLTERADKLNSAVDGSGEKSLLQKIFGAPNAADVARIEAEINTVAEKIIEARSRVDGGQASQDVAESPRVMQEKAVSQAILQERQKLAGEVASLREQENIAEAEAFLASQDITMEQREQTIERLREFETRKAQVELQAQLEKNESIQDARAQELANEKALSEARIKLAESENKEKDRLQKLEEQRGRLALQAATGFLQAGISLAKQGSAEQKALQSALTVVSTYSAATQALASPPGPPFTIPLAAAVVAQGLANLAKINSQSFQGGGVVGGFGGATAGGDNTVAQVRTGELVLNAEQQRRLFDIASGTEQGLSSAGVGGPQEIVVEIDGREIARTVRDQREAGFAV